MKRVITFLMGVAALTFVTSASAQTVLYQTDFESPAFTTGNLVPQDGWANHSGTGSLIQVVSPGIVGQSVELVQGDGSREDANISLGQTMGVGNIFSFAFDVVVNGVDDATTTYFAHFRDDGTGFNSRVFVTTPNAAMGNFTFGIGETSSSNVASTFATDFNYGQTYRLAGSYNFDTGISFLTVDGGMAIDSTSQADPGEDISTFALRQAGGNTSMLIDNLVVTAAIPEPGSFGVLALVGSLGFIRRRK